MLPQPATSPRSKNAFVDMSTSKRYKYLKRIFKWRHMDFEFALWQMVYLCCAPRRVYRNFHYHKETKHQWARDDPAFLVLLSFWLFVSSLIFAVSLHLGIIGFIKFLLWVIFVDCIGVGLVIAGFLLLVTNKYLRIPGSSSIEHVVEFGYSFDVHLNAFFPLLIILHMVQLIGLLFDPNLFIARFFGNTSWLIALTYYIYITFLGYSALPFLRNTAVLLYPFVALAIIYILSLSFSWNITQGIVDFYKYRVI